MTEWFPHNRYLTSRSSSTRRSDFSLKPMHVYALPDTLVRWYILLYSMVAASPFPSCRSISTARVSALECLRLATATPFCILPDQAQHCTLQSTLHHSSSSAMRTNTGFFVTMAAIVSRSVFCQPSPFPCDVLPECNGVAGDYMMAVQPACKHAYKWDSHRTMCCRQVCNVFKGKLYR